MLVNKAIRVKCRFIWNSKQWHLCSLKPQATNLARAMNVCYDGSSSGDLILANFRCLLHFSAVICISQVKKPAPSHSLPLVI